jgi:Spy/CpxP family protein refolding chaperone
MTRRALVTLLATLALGAGPPALAQGSAPPTPPQAQDPLGSKLFPPELIMTHQAEIGLEDRQREAIVKELEKAQAQFPRLQWQLQAATEQLVKLLDAPQIDEAKALAQAGEVMKLETEIKRAHLGLLIRIRNTLSEAQRAKLQALRRGGP